MNHFYRTNKENLYLLYKKDENAPSPSTPGDIDQISNRLDESSKNENKSNNTQR